MLLYVFSVLNTHSSDITLNVKQIKLETNNYCISLYPTTSPIKVAEVQSVIFTITKSPTL